jgi:hypothetical protein
MHSGAKAGLALLLALSPCLAQHHGGVRFAVGINTRGGFHGRGFGANGFAYPVGYPWFGGYDYAAPPPAAQPLVIVVPYPMAPPAAPYQPETAKPVLHEYKPEPDPPGEPAAFSIALKDGTVRYAAAVWVSDGRVNYFSPDGASGALDAAAVDHARTRSLNLQKNLQLQLPAVAQQ